MNLIKRNFSGTFFKMLLYIAIAMLIIILLLSNVLYRVFEEKGLAIINDYNTQSIMQTTFNIHYMNDMVKNFCTTNFRQPEVQQLMLNNEDDSSVSVDSIKSVNMLHEAVASNSMMDSIVVYNSVNKKYYSTTEWNLNPDKQIIDMVEGKVESPLLFPIPRILPPDLNGNQSEQIVFTYVLYNSKNTDKSMNSSLIVNVKTDWLFQNIKKLGNDKTNLILVDENLNVIGDKNNEFMTFDKLPEGYALENINNDQAGKSFITMVLGQKRVVTYMPIPNTGWIIIDDQPYDMVFQFIRDVKNQTVLVTLVLLVLAFIGAVYISKQVYRPFGILLEQVKSSFKNVAFAAGKNDDARYLSQVFNDSIHRIKELEKYRNTTRDIVKENILKTLLLESTSMVNQIHEDDISKGDTLFGKNNEVRIVLLKVDDYAIFSGNELETRKAVRFMISNIASEVMSEICTSEVILMGQGECVILMDVSRIQGPNMRGMIQDKLQLIQNRVKEFTQFSVSAFISEAVTDINMLNQAYRDLQNYSRYRLIYGNCILFNGPNSKSANKATIEYPERVESKIIDGIKTRSLESVIQEFDVFLSIISEMDIDSFVLSLTRFILSLNRVVNTMNINRVNEISIDFDDFNHRLMKIETKEVLRNEFIELFTSLDQEQLTNTEYKHSVIVDSVVNYIKKEYSSKELCLKSIAAEFKLSSMYLGLIFKDYTKKSVQECINEVRLEKAADLLKNTEYSVNEVMNLVGFDSVSNFYKLFKKRYGTTPKEQRLTANLIDKSKTES